ncbi:hypothetical protein O181_009163 [Austropuccinia psidii MF-1]|uniref:Uncharacterized protein n=1 Tax=Austropuccinia psidii MF-1 TaxID=1389203 RepID=A0A9Q3GJ71_9BASI|nr:hypothetical protein [Austropuccinia psidii MF-1]
MTSKVLTCCQSLWAEFLSKFHFSITYFPFCLANLPDALSGKDNIYPERGEDSIRNNTINSQQLIKEDEVRPKNSFHSRDPQFDSVHINKDTPSGELSSKVQSVPKDLKRKLEFAINRFKRYVDKSRASPPVFNLGDMGWISSKKVKSTIPTKKTVRKMVLSFSNLEESKYSCLLAQAPISMEVHPPSLPHFPPGTSQDIKYPKQASRDSSSNYHSRRREMGSLSSTVCQAKESKTMISCGMEGFQ